MIALFLLLVIVAIALGLVGVVVKGLLWLLFIGIVVLLGALLLAALRIRRRPGRSQRVNPSPHSGRHGELTTNCGVGAAQLSRGLWDWAGDSADDGAAGEYVRDGAVQAQVR